MLALLALVLAARSTSPATADSRYLRSSGRLPGRTHYQVLDPSGLHDEPGDFDARNVFDLWPTSAWCTPARKDGVGAWFEFAMRRPANGFGVFTGFQQEGAGRSVDGWPGHVPSAAFLQHGRAKVLALRLPDGTVRRLRLDDRPGEQRFALALPRGKYRATIESSYPGSVMHDACVGGMMFATHVKQPKHLLPESATPVFVPASLSTFDGLRGTWACDVGGAQRWVKIEREPPSWRAGDPVKWFELAVSFAPEDPFDNRTFVHPEPSDLWTSEIDGSRVGDKRPGFDTDHPYCTDAAGKYVAATTGISGVLPNRAHPIASVPNRRRGHRRLERRSARTRRHAHARFPPAPDLRQARDAPPRLQRPGARALRAPARAPRRLHGEVERHLGRRAALRRQLHARPALNPAPRRNRRSPQCVTP